MAIPILSLGHGGLFWATFPRGTGKGGKQGWGTESGYVTPRQGDGSTALVLAVAHDDTLGANPPEAKVGCLAGGTVVLHLGAQHGPVVGHHGHHGQHDAHQDAEEGRTDLQCFGLGHGGHGGVGALGRVGQQCLPRLVAAGLGWWQQLWCRGRELSLVFWAKPEWAGLGAEGHRTGLSSCPHVTGA